MPLSNESELVSFDIDAVRTAIEDVITGRLRSLVEYTKDEFNPLYIDEVTLSFYDDEEHLLNHFTRIHSYVNIDFTEMNLFTEDLFPNSGRIRYLVTGLDTFTILRIYRNGEGLFIALDPDEPTQPIVDAIEQAIDRNR